MILMREAHKFEAALSHGDPTEFLDTLSVGIVMLDSQLCLTYANPVALQLLAIRAENARGMPLAMQFQPCAVLMRTLRAVLGGRRIGYLPGLPLQAAQHRPSPFEPGRFDITVRALDGFVTGAHLMLEVVSTKRPSTRRTQ